MEPKLLVTLSGEKIKTAEDWERYRRPECLSLLTEYVYGKAPTAAPKTLSFEIEQKKNINKLTFELWCLLRSFSPTAAQIATQPQDVRRESTY